MSSPNTIPDYEPDDYNEIADSLDIGLCVRRFLLVARVCGYPEWIDGQLYVKVRLANGWEDYWLVSDLKVVQS